MPKKRVTSRKNLERLASFTEINPRPVVEVSMSGNIIYLNPSASHLFPNLKKKKLKHPYLINLLKMVEFLKNHPGEDYVREVKVKNRWFRSFLYYLPQFNSILIYGTDITERKNAEQEKDNFISIMSHELRNPLASIQANIEFLQTNIESTVGKNFGLDQYLDPICRQTKNMASLLDDLLDISRLNRSKLILNRKVVDMREAVQHAIETTLPFIKEKSQKLSIALPPKPVYIQGDPVRLEQIIVNLLSNASKYTKNKGSIQIKLAVVKKRAELIVKDNGIGILADEIQHIFELFKRSPHQTLNSKGLGIGLNITKHLVTMQDGTLTAKSRGKNKGSAFTVRFPLHTQKMAPVAKPKLEESYQQRLTGLRVLMVEDNKDIAVPLSKLLHLSGHEVKIAYNGNSAIKMFKQFKPHIGLIDIGLPGISGYDVAKKIRQEKSNIKLIAMTGYGQEKDKIMALQAGFDHHLTKPVDIPKLLKLLS